MQHAHCNKIKNKKQDATCSQLFFHFLEKFNFFKEFVEKVFLLSFYLHKILHGIFSFATADHSWKDSHSKPQGNFENVSSFLNGVKPTYSLFPISFDMEIAEWAYSLEKSSGYVILSIVN